MNVQVGLKMSFIDVLLILLERYSSAGWSNVAKPKIYSKNSRKVCLTYTDLKNNRKKYRSSKDTSAAAHYMSMPNIIMNMFNMKSITYLLVEIE